MKQDKNTSQVVFLLGAGASVNAGVPDTYSFVKEFKASIADHDKKVTVNKIIETLERWKGEDIDVELLLETLTKLDAKKEEPILRFFKNIDEKFILKDYSTKQPIIEDLKDFIKSKAIIKSGDQIKYFESLLGFIEEFRPLDIISVNYDTSIEQFCNVNKLSYQDGFDVYWNPNNFEAENTDLRLYKLHGSVMWYRSDKGGYIKLPVMTEESSIQLITGEKAESLMLYPMQKWDYAEPILELLVEIKRRLESESCKFLIVVGYSFRDDHILRILWDITKKNRRLNIIIIDPNAYQIYSEKLKYYDKEKMIPSSLDGKVVCLPYKFEKIFPILKDYYLKNLRDGLSCVNRERQNELKGEKANWVSCLKSLENAEFTDKIDEILEKIEHSEIDKDWQLGLELLLKLGLNFAANGLFEKAQKYLRKLTDQLYLIFVERLNMNVSVHHSVIEINFNYISTDSGAYLIPANTMNTFIDILGKDIEIKRMMIARRIKQIENVRKTINKIKKYLEPLCKERLVFDKYIQIRKKEVPNIEDIVLENRSKLSNKLTSVLTEIEQNILKKIIQ